MLTNSLKISDQTKRDVFQLNFSDINGKLGSKCCCPDFSSVWDPLTQGLWKGVLKQELLSIKVTTLFGINSIGNT